MRCFCSSLFAVFLASVPLCAFASHPADGQPTNSLDKIYAAGNCGHASDWDRGDITMSDVKPDPLTLTQLEKYMVAGSRGSSFPDGLGLRAWDEELWLAVKSYYDQTGSLPTEMTPDVLRQIPQLASASDLVLSVYSNPLTGAWPKVNATVPSPGDLYIRPLDQVEMRFYGDKDQGNYEEWFEGTGARGRQIRLDGKVWYVRMYGLHGVLCEKFFWMMEPY